MYLLDTNILIYAQKKRSPVLIRKVEAMAMESMHVSLFTVAEMMFGCEKSSRPIQNQSALREFLLPFDVIGFGREDCAVYGSIRAKLELDGTPIGTIDTLIASQAFRRGWTLVTNNVREFSRVPGLKIENWA
jgi:tRNA(fMet)-specific endonuclease VapC